jgi:hypothetical protein
MNCQQFFGNKLPAAGETGGRVGVGACRRKRSIGVVEYWGQPSAFFSNRYRSRSSVSSEGNVSANRRNGAQPSLTLATDPFN